MKFGYVVVNMYLCANLVKYLLINNYYLYV